MIVPQHHRAFRGQLNGYRSNRCPIYLERHAASIHQHRKVSRNVPARAEPSRCSTRKDCLPLCSDITRQSEFAFRVDEEEVEGTRCGIPAKGEPISLGTLYRTNFSQRLNSRVRAWYGNRRPSQTRCFC